MRGSRRWKNSSRRWLPRSRSRLPAAHDGHALGDFTIPQPSTNRDAKGTTPNSRGPDIKEIETAMRFDGGRQSILGDADEVHKSGERRKIVSASKERS
jgi:hypothetical protein